MGKRRKRKSRELPQFELVEKKKDCNAKGF